MDRAVKDLLTEYRLEHHADTLLKLGVRCSDDLVDLHEHDLDGFTVVEKNRYMRLSRAIASGVSTAGIEDDSGSVASTSSWLSSNVSQSGDATVLLPRASRSALYRASLNWDIRPKT